MKAISRYFSLEFLFKKGSLYLEMQYMRFLLELYVLKEVYFLLKHCYTQEELKIMVSPCL